MMSVRRLEIRATGFEIGLDVPGATALIGNERESVSGTDGFCEDGVEEDGEKTVADC